MLMLLLLKYRHSRFHSRTTTTTIPTNRDTRITPTDTTVTTTPLTTNSNWNPELTRNVNTSIVVDQTRRIRIWRKTSSSSSNINLRPSAIVFTQQQLVLERRGLSGTIFQRRGRS